jgi:flagellar hook-associated protein 1 FlgK
MQNLFGNLEVGRRSLLAQQLALQVTGNNVANVNTPGYTRQRAVLTESPAEDTAAGPIGTGVDVKLVESVRDHFLEARLASAIQDSSRDDAITGYLNQVQSISGVTQTGLRDALSRFFNSFSSLATDASSLPLRSSVLSAAQNVTAVFQNSAQHLTDIRENADAAIVDAVNQINALTARIASLNQQITSSEFGGSQANSLRDQRTEAVNQLASFIDIHYYEAADGTLSVSTAGQTLVTADFVQTLHTERTGPYGFSQIMAGQNDITGSIQGGRLAGLVQIRDVVVPNYQADLDALAASLINEVNTVHRAGTDIQIPPTSPGLDFFSPVSGTPGAAKAISVNAVILGDPRYLAAGQSGAPGDNANALALADLGNQRLLASGTQTFADAVASLQSRIGTDAQRAQSQAETNNAIRTQLENSRDAVSGVSLDEEAVGLIRFQRAYQASAKYISVIDELMQHIITTLGT